MNAPTNPQPEFAIQRIYIKDLSFESPASPKVFRGEWNPEVNFELNTSHSHLEENFFEVTVAVTVTAKVANTVAFIVEVKQAGIFSITGVDEAHKQAILNSFCPTILFPYLRETVSDVVSRGSFPQLYLSPINFDALYAEQQQAKNQSSVITN